MQNSVMNKQQKKKMKKINEVYKSVSLRDKEAQKARKKRKSVVEPFMAGKGTERRRPCLSLRKLNDPNDHDMTDIMEASTSAGPDTRFTVESTTATATPQASGTGSYAIGHEHMKRAQVDMEFIEVDVEQDDSGGFADTGSASCSTDGDVAVVAEDVLKKPKRREHGKKSLPKPNESTDAERLARYFDEDDIESGPEVRGDVSADAEEVDGDEGRLVVSADAEEVDGDEGRLVVASPAGAEPSRPHVSESEDDAMPNDSERLADARRRSLTGLLKKRRKSASAARRRAAPMQAVVRRNADKAYQCHECRLRVDIIGFRCSCGKFYCTEDECKSKALTHMVRDFHLMISENTTQAVIQRLTKNIVTYLNNGGCFRLFASDVDLQDPNQFCAFTRISAASDARCKVEWSTCDRGFDLFEKRSLDLLSGHSEETTTAVCNIEMNTKEMCRATWSYNGCEPPIRTIKEMYSHYSNQHNDLRDNICRCPASRCNGKKPIKSWHEFNKHVKLDHPFHQREVMSELWAKLKVHNCVKIPNPMKCTGNMCQSDPDSSPPIGICMETSCNKYDALCPACSAVTCSNHVCLFLQAKCRNTIFDVIRLRKSFQTIGGVAEFLARERRTMQNEGFAPVDSILFVDPRTKTARVVWTPETMSVNNLSHGKQNEVWLAYKHLPKVGCPFRQCRWTFVYAPDLLDHVAKKHCRPTVLSCKICPKVKGTFAKYSSWILLAQHVQNEHNDGRQISNEFWPQQMAYAREALQADKACVAEKLETLSTLDDEVFLMKDSLSTEEYQEGYD